MFIFSTYSIVGAFLLGDCMKKGIYKKLNILFSLVLVFVCAFSLPCFAKQWTEIPNHMGTFTAHYSYTYDNAPDGGSGIRSGDSVLTYESQRVFYANLFYLFNGAPFGFAEAHKFYQLDVTMKDIQIQPDASDNDFWLKFNFALCNRNTVKSLDDVLVEIKLLNANNLLVQNVDYSVSNNIVYVDDVFRHVSSGMYKIRISFLFARTNSTPDVDFSDYTHFGITQISYGRNDDLGDVVGSIQDSTDQILNDVGDGSVVDSTNNANSSSQSVKDKESQITDLLPENDLVLDLEQPLSLVAAFTYINDWFTEFVNGLGVEFHFLWWTLIYLGLLGTLLGAVIMIAKKGGK